MKKFSKIWLTLSVLCALASCREASESKNDEAGQPHAESRIGTFARSQGGPTQGGPTGGERSQEKMTKVAKLVSELKEISAPQEKRDFFADMMLGLPTDEHEIAVEVVIDDLNSKEPANLVTEYLEMSSFMSPALQLPGIVRLLEEPKLLPLQRAAMEQQLRQDLGISPDQAVSDWRLLVADHLRKNESLISE